MTPRPKGLKQQQKRKQHIGIEARDRKEKKKILFVLVPLPTGSC